jgi:hypothetical protein
MAAEKSAHLADRGGLASLTEVLLPRPAPAVSSGNPRRIDLPYGEMLEREWATGVYPCDI